MEVRSSFGDLALEGSVGAGFTHSDVCEDGTRGEVEEAIWTFAHSDVRRWFPGGSDSGVVGKSDGGLDKSVVSVINGCASVLDATVVVGC